MDELNKGPTEAGVIADLADRAKAAQLVMVGDRPFLISPKGADVREITDQHGLTPGAPARIKQAVVLQTMNSLINYALRFKTDDSILFADILANRIVAAIDYHGPATAANLDHSAAMTLPYSEEWKTWTAVDGKLIPQLEFARFIEENAVDIETPSGAALLEIVRDMQAIRKVDFRQAIRTSSENESFEYVDQTDAASKGEIEIPTKFALRLPVYFDGATTPLMAFLRWKFDEGKLFLGVKLHRAEHVRQAVFKEIVENVASLADLPAVYGKTN